MSQSSFPFGESLDLLWSMFCESHSLSNDPDEDWARFLAWLVSENERAYKLLHTY